MTGDFTRGFTGAKGAILARGGVVTLLRDDFAGLPWPGWWDLPGGGRDGTETAWECFARETFEEVGLGLSRRDLRWRRVFRLDDRPVVFFAVEMPSLRADALRLGSEGQAVRLMPIARFLRHERAIPSLRARLAAYRLRRLCA